MTIATAAAQLSQLMVDHPGWFVWAGHGYAQRAFRSGDTVWMISCRDMEASFEPVIEVVHQGSTPASACPVVDTFDANDLPPAVHLALFPGGAPRIHRVRNPDVWDAMLMPVFRHRRRIADAADMYRAFCARYGTVVSTELGNTLLPPLAETAATLDDDPEVAGRRMATIRAVANEYLRLRPDKTQLPRVRLFGELLNLPHIGAWSAARIVADTTGDFSFYEHAGFGSDHHWRRHVAETGTHVQEDTLETLWRSCTHEQKSIVIALTNHRRLSISSKTEAATIDGVNTSMAGMY